MLVFLTGAIELDPKLVGACASPKRWGYERTLIAVCRANRVESLPCLFEKSAVQALSSTQPRSNLLRAILLAGEWGSISGGLKTASDTAFVVVSKPKLSNMRELEPRIEELSKTKGICGTGLTACCSSPAWTGMSFLTQGDF